MFKKYFSEAIGTFALVFCGTGAIIINEFTNGAVTHPGVAITFGLIVMGMIYAFGDISGAHINPAVTIAFAVAKRFSWKNVPGYIISQLIGAIVASAILLFLFPENELLGTTLPQIEGFKVLILEIILSFFLMVVIINVSTGAKEIGAIAGMAIGGIVLLEAMFAGPITGASMNPARSIAPALISGHLEHLWIYIVGPVIGCILAVLTCKLVKEDSCCEDNC